MANEATLTTGDVGPTLFRMTVPMVGGMFAMVAFHFADTYFVARLGTRELAAISFTFPVVMFVGSIALGLGMGTSAVISRTIGQGDHADVRRLATHSLTLAVLVVLVVATVGVLTIDPMFTLMGATPDILGLIRQYMTIWYVGVAFVVVPMVGNNAIRATGDTVLPGLIMIAGAAVNVILDPLLIFGLAGFPRLEMAGAAWATVISRATTLIVALGVLHFGKHLLDPSLLPLRTIWGCWKRILHIGVPATATNLLMPVSMGVVTWMAAGFGKEAVAALGAGGRVQGLSLLVIGALSSALVPFVGQNWGAGHRDRARRAYTVSSLFSLGWGLLSLAVFIAVSRPVAGLFSNDPLVVDHIVRFLWIVPIGYGMQGVGRLVSVTLNAINRPMHAAALTVVRLVVLLVPLAYLGSQWFGLKGLFAGVAVANVLAGIVAWVWIQQVCKRGRVPHPEAYRRE